MNLRLKKLVAVFDQQEIDILLVTNDTNITYLTGFPSFESWLCVGPRRACYITDFRYVLEARNGLKGIDVERYATSIYGTLFKVATQMNAKRIGIDERHLTLDQFRMLKQKCPRGVQLVRANCLVEQFREIKDVAEVRQIKKALDIHRVSHQFLKRVVKPDVTEKEILFKLEHFVKSHNAGFSFSPIIASGKNSCYPHACVTERKVLANEPVLIDMGIDVNGYKSDLTRMFFLGKITAHIRRVNDCVLEAQRRAISKIRAGVLISEIDYEARNYLEKKGLAKYFGHALGHGVGLEVHESPRIAQSNSSILKEGMVITVEPAVYIPGKFGVRIEDMVLVKKKKCEILSDDIH